MSGESAAVVLLLRGINVGGASRVPMADLRDIVEGAGFIASRTLLQSGNVVVRPPAGELTAAIAAIEAALFERLTVRSRVTAIAAPEFAAIAEANPLLEVASDFSRLTVTFCEPFTPSQLELPPEETLDPEQVRLGAAAVYLWSPLGVSKSRLTPRFWRQFGPAATTRNWRMVLKLLDALAELSPERSTATTTHLTFP